MAAEEEGKPMTQDQFQTAKEVLEHHGYRVIVFNGHMAMTNRSHNVFKLRHVKEEDKIYMVPIAEFFSAGQIKKEFATVYEVMINLQLNGVPVVM